MNFDALIGIIVSTFVFTRIWSHKSDTIRFCIYKDPDYLVRNINLQYLDILSRILLWASAIWILVCLVTVKSPAELSLQSIGSLFLFGGYVLSTNDRDEAGRRAIAIFSQQLEFEKEKRRKEYPELFT